MSKVTSKLQITVPKVVAEQYGIRPGDDVDWVPAGDSIRLIPPSRARPIHDIEARLRLFDQATQRQKQRNDPPIEARASQGRGWTREELYDRG